MIRINYPDKKPSIRKEQGKELVFCIIRRRWVVLSPEEWVRQNFLLYLTEVLAYPSSLIAVEKQLLLGDVKKRFDIVVFNRQTKPYMLVECKEMNVQLTESVVSQALRYNIPLQAALLVITNGSYSAAFERRCAQFEPIAALPGFSD
ncbi:MAG: type I restriction enzyme HsdR N-terminal domain-containing protein [Bacteroidetes bacterium]|nr:type I restriction enzyme HsdR N-terminal domain-containing protein [Bacteroidota bacterium]